MNSPVQHSISQRNKKVVISVGIIIGGLWVMLVMYLLKESRVPYNAVQPGNVATSTAPSYSGPSATYTGSDATGSSLLHHNVPTTPLVYRDVLPQQPMSSTSIHVYQTSSASVKSIGGGSSTGVIATTNGSSSGSKGINYAGLSYGGNMLALSSSLALAAPGASQANELSHVGAAAPRRVKMDEYPDDFEDPIPDEVVTPVGDVAWLLMALLAAAYAFFCYRRRTRA